MHPLNPFLRAFFASKLSSQCYPSENFVLLVPNTEFLFLNRDHDTQTEYTHFFENDEFLASHILRIPNSPAGGNSKDAVALRDVKGKARQYNTLDGRIIVIKDIFAYTNKGFKNLTQAQLVQDEVYYSNTGEISQWLIYYISRPLLGTPEPIVSKPLPPNSSPAAQSDGVATGNSGVSGATKQVQVKLFSELLDQFPAIARQMQPGLEKLFQQFKMEVEKPLPKLPSLSASSTLSDDGSSRPGTSTSIQSSEATLVPNTSTSTDAIDQDTARNAAETLVTSAVDVFHNVDKQQLSVLAAATNLSGPVLERMIERYVIEQVHDRMLFPHVTAANAVEDERLERCKIQMGSLDISQLGLTEDEGLPPKRQLARRIAGGVEAFKKMGAAGSPEEMLQVLLDTEKRVTFSSPEDVQSSGLHQVDGVSHTVFATNADTLVSLLLLVIIRSPVRYLYARLAYMRDFSFVEDVESGEVGYALSTYEAVLAYISNNSRGLRKISRANKALLTAVKKGDLEAVKRSLELSDAVVAGDSQDDSGVAGVADDSSDDRVRFEHPHVHAHHESPEIPNEESDSQLAHVFPWKRSSLITQPSSKKVKKRVSMAARSFSSSSIRSGLSRISTAESVKSTMTGEVHPDQLCFIDDADGNSLLMTAIENNRAAALEFLLSLDDMIKPTAVLRDQNNEGTTLLSAAVQGGKAKIVKIMLNYVKSQTADCWALADYLSIQDVKGRSFAHYVFNSPQLIADLDWLIPWNLKDKNGQTPLFATFRSYDLTNYTSVAEAAMRAATSHDGLTGPLQLDDHVDNKGNTLLHIVHDPKLIRQLLYHCNSDPNATNDRRFTPLMVASKFARVDIVRTLFGDERVDLQTRDLRNLTAVELAKDDEVRNRIDDMLLLSAMPTPPSLSAFTAPNSSSVPPEERKTTLVRSIFIDDLTIRLIIKSGARNPNATITVTTCRRSLSDFENLAKWLCLEHPASFMPSISRLRTPFQIPSKPSRQALRDTQLRLDAFLQILLHHPTFSTHEMLWEFILVPDIDTTMLAERAKAKAALRLDRLAEDYEPLLSAAGITGAETFINHARDQIYTLHQAYKSLLRNVGSVRNTSADIAEANRIAAVQVAALGFLPDRYPKAMTRYAETLRQTEYGPLTGFLHALISALSCTNALHTALSRPASLIRAVKAAQETLGKMGGSGSVGRVGRWQGAFGLLEEARSNFSNGGQKDAGHFRKIEEQKSKVERLGRELEEGRRVVAVELAGWQGGHGEGLRRDIKVFARKSLVIERERLEGMKRGLRQLNRGDKVNGDAFAR